MIRWLCTTLNAQPVTLVEDVAGAALNTNCTAYRVLGFCGRNQRRGIELSKGKCILKSFPIFSTINFA